MAQQPKTGAAQTTSMSEFLAKAKQLAEAKLVGAPVKGRGQNYGAATRKKWSRTADAPGEPPQPGPSDEASGTD